MLEQWPDVPFDESMLESDVVIHCPNKELVEDLFEIFRKTG